MIRVLDEIMLSKNVVDNFYNAYLNDPNFANWINTEIPQIKQCEEQKQNNPWHKYNVLGHILHSVEEMNRLTIDFAKEERRMLAYVMLFHDIGKPDCHIERIKDGKKIDSFFNHNIKSAEIAEQFLPKLGFTEKEIIVMLKLIYKHDIFMFIKTEKTNNPYWKELTNELILSEIKDLNKVGDGYKLIKYLVLVGRCDNLSQNEKMTKNSLKMLEKFEKMVENLKNNQEINKIS